MSPVDTTGVGDYMLGLHAFADPVVKGSAKILSANYQLGRVPFESPYWN
jgi:hypothetical protein